MFLSREVIEYVTMSYQIHLSYISIRIAEQGLPLWLYVHHPNMAVLSGKYKYTHSGTLLNTHIKTHDRGSVQVNPVWCVISIHINMLMRLTVSWQEPDGRIVPFKVNSCHYSIVIN